MDSFLEQTSLSGHYDYEVARFLVPSETWSAKISSPLAFLVIFSRFLLLSCACPGVLVRFLLDALSSNQKGSAKRCLVSRQGGDVTRERRLGMCEWLSEWTLVVTLRQRPCRWGVGIDGRWCAVGYRLMSSARHGRRWQLLVYWTSYWPGANKAEAREGES